MSRNKVGRRLLARSLCHSGVARLLVHSLWVRKLCELHVTMDSAVSLFWKPHRRWLTSLVKLWMQSQQSSVVQSGGADVGAENWQERNHLVGMWIGCIEPECGCVLPKISSIAFLKKIPITSFCALLENSTNTITVGPLLGFADAGVAGNLVHVPRVCAPEEHSHPSVCI